MIYKMKIFLVFMWVPDKTYLIGLHLTVMYL